MKLLKLLKIIDYKCNERNGVKKQQKNDPLTVAHFFNIFLFC